MHWYYKIQATFKGQKTNILALVTPALNGEVILSWRALQCLDVILEDFPNSQGHVTANATKSLPNKGPSINDITLQFQFFDHPPSPCHPALFNNLQYTILEIYFIVSLFILLS